MANTSPPSDPWITADLGISEGVKDAEKKSRPREIPITEMWYRSRNEKTELIFTDFCDLMK